MKMAGKELSRGMLPRRNGNCNIGLLLCKRETQRGRENGDFLQRGKMQTYTDEPANSRPAMADG